MEVGRDAAGEEGEQARSGPPLILWNHRWEYDKNPDEFFKALYVLDDRGCDFRVAILGENFKRSPAVFEEARVRLGAKVVHYGFVEDFPSYARWLRRADILPVTSIHDFFGASVVEAVYAGAWPILPRRLAYPEHFPEDVIDICFYDDFDGLVEKLEDAVKSAANSAANSKDKLRGESLKDHVKKYDWQTMAPLYDDEFASLTAPAGGV
jgi:glycosyltransferase involved in cell wall biosynthesis